MAQEATSTAPPRRADSIAAIMLRLGGLEALQGRGPLADQVAAFAEEAGGIVPAARLLRVPRSSLAGFLAGGARRGTIVLIETTWQAFVVEGRAS